MDRVILHCDMNGFFASVELLDRPDLVDKPMAVCGDPESRHGIILAKNEIAKSFGIVTAETIWQAKKKCPNLQLVPPHHEKYKEYSIKINKIYQEYTDLVEPFSIDESWLDVTASQLLFGSGRQIADTIRQRVKEELGLTLSVGVSYNKIFAKMGSEYKKPDATTEITRDNFKDILWPMDIKEMFFVGAATAEKLRHMGIRTIGDLALANPAVLEKALGKQGPVLRAYAAGLDDSPVARFDHHEQAKSLGHGITFSRDIKGFDEILTAVTNIADMVASRLRKEQLKCHGVKVEIKDPAFHTISRQKQLHRPSHLATEIRQAAMEIIQASWNLSSPIRLLTITAINLTDETVDEQISLFDAPAADQEKGESMEKAMDDIRQKFGNSAISFGQWSK